MSVTGPDLRLPTDPAIRQEIERVRASGVLGQTGRMRELFDFLAQRSGDELPPKEAEIAAAVFGKTDAAATKDDPVARVYVHRLRKRLDAFYERSGAPDGVRLELPKGQYRLVGRDVTDGAAAEAGAPAGAGPARRRAWRPAAIGAFAALLLAANLGAWALLAGRPGPAPGSAPAHPVWSPLAGSDRPLTVVVGDYYMFGDFGDGAYVNRLVRDFSINSREELLARRLQDPSVFDRYTDVDLQYLPISVAFALGDVLPLVGDGRRIEVSLSSDLTPGMMRDNDILYVGLLSGLGMLREPVFAASRFSIGESYDELIDTRTGKSFISEAFMADPYDGMARDYGYFSSFPGPTGNRIMVIAGARDTAAAGVAERLSEPRALDALAEAAGGADAFEALYEIEGQGHVSMDGRILTAGALDPAHIWTADAPPRVFPSE